MPSRGAFNAAMAAFQRIDLQRFMLAWCWNGVCCSPLLLITSGSLAVHNICVVPDRAPSQVVSY